jgi:putative aldouronate transport system permease protein
MESQKLMVQKPFVKTVVIQRQLILMSLPLVLYVLLFSYVPIWGWTMAFQNFKPSRSFFKQEWVGLQQFRFLFSAPEFLRALRNTLAMSLINIALGYVTAIVFALFLNELKNIGFKRMVQTISYLPHFLSWINVTGLVASML